MSRPSILFINRVYPPVRGASGRALRDLARMMAREGWQVSVVTTGLKKTRERDGGVHVTCLSARQRPANVFQIAWLSVRMTMAALRAPRHDVVVTLSDPPILMALGWLVAKIRKSRHIHWCRELQPDLFFKHHPGIPGFAQRMIRRTAHAIMKSTDKIIVPGRCVARMIATKGIDSTKIAFIPHWPDQELTRPDHAQSEKQVHRVMSLSPGVAMKSFESQIKDGPKFRVLYAGNIGRANPVDAILNAAAILDETNPEIEFVFVGDGTRFDDIARERVRRGLDNIRLMPFQPQSRLREVMESGDVHLVTLRADAAGLVVPCKLMAALAAGRPTIYIGPPDTEIARVIADYACGTTVAPDDGAGLAAAIRTYRESGDKWFKDHEGALAAAVFNAKDAIQAWIERAFAVANNPR